MFQARDIYNLDECGIQTVHKLTKVITDIGDKFVAKMTSAERGSLVTMVGIISAIGRAVPPLIFPRVKFNETTMLRNAFSGTSGGANPSRWINSELFLQVLQHFAAHERPSKSSPLMIILDNHETHINLPAINFCRDNGIVLLTLPPHSSHKLQPLDVSVYRSFKLHFNGACSTWMVNHPGMAISIMDMAELAGKAFGKSFTLSNITSGFSKSGIEPFNDQIFTDDDFNPARVTDRNLPTPLEQRALVEPSAMSVAMPALSINTTSSSTIINESLLAIAGPSSITDHVTPNKPTNEETAITPPEDVCPYPKAKPRKASNKGRKKGKSLILTSTPVKNSIEAKIQRKKDLEQEKLDRKKVILEKQEAKKKEKVEKLTRKEEMMKKKAEDKENKIKKKVNGKEQKKRNVLKLGFLFEKIENAAIR